jgi:hypothetical protein
MPEPLYPKWNEGNDSIMNEKDLHEMGWNDTVGNIRRAFNATAAEKVAFCKRILDDKMPMVRSETAYAEGAKEAARQIVAGAAEETLDFRGSEDVIEHMKSLLS